MIKTESKQFDITMGYCSQSTPSYTTLPHEHAL